MLATMGSFVAAPQPGRIYKPPKFPAWPVCGGFSTTGTHKSAIVLRRSVVWRVVNARRGQSAGAVRSAGIRELEADHAAEDHHEERHPNERRAFALRENSDRGHATTPIPVQAVLEGLSIQARDGASRESMHAVIDCAMAAWEPTTGPVRGARD
jgi:hypothetical protein